MVTQASRPELQPQHSCVTPPPPPPPPTSRQQLRAEGCRGLLQTLRLPPEQLVYVAALAVQSPLIFGDQPMRLTLQRLISQPSLQDLDRAYATQVWAGLV